MLTKHCFIAAILCCKKTDNMKNLTLVFAIMVCSIFSNLYAQITTDISRITDKVVYQPDKYNRLFVCKILPENPSFVEGKSVQIKAEWNLNTTSQTYQWFQDDVAMNAQNAAELTVTKAGKYKVLVTYVTKNKRKSYTTYPIEVIALPALGTTTTTIKNLQVAGINYKLYEPSTATYPTPKGILVVGSGNDGNNPSIGSLTGTTENDLCKMAADNGYVAAVVAYKAGTPNPQNGNWEFWNNNAKQLAQDFDKCIVDLSTKYNVAKTKSVIAGVSYTSYAMLTAIATDNTVAYCQGLIASCGGTDEWKAANIKIPIYSLTCNNNPDGNYSGQALYDKIPATNVNKAKSEGYTDASCTTHCGGNWVQLMFNKLKVWVP